MDFPVLTEKGKEDIYLEYEFDSCDAYPKSNLRVRAEILQLSNTRGNRIQVLQDQSKVFINTGL